MLSVSFCDGLVSYVLPAVKNCFKQQLHKLDLDSNGSTGNKLGATMVK